MSDIFSAIFSLHNCFVFKYSDWKQWMKLLLGKHELALQNLPKNYGIEYLTTEVELVLPNFKSCTVHKIIEYLTLGLLFSLWNIYQSTTAYFFDPPCIAWV